MWRFVQRCSASDLRSQDLGYQLFQPPNALVLLGNWGTEAIGSLWLHFQLPPLERCDAQWKIQSTLCEFLHSIPRFKKQLFCSARPPPPPTRFLRTCVCPVACLLACLLPVTFCVNRLINLDQSINPSINQSINESMVLKDSLHVQIYFEFLRSSPSIYLPIYLSIYLAS